MAWLVRSVFSVGCVAIVRGVQHGVDGVLIENMHDTPYSTEKELGETFSPVPNHIADPDLGFADPEPAT